MKAFKMFFFVSVFFIVNLPAQDLNLKEKAIEEFKNEHYTKAIDILEKAKILTPDDAEIYYYLGFFNHYKANDSRPLCGYNYDYSKIIFRYLEKALKLNPNHGNAKYFYGAECSANAFKAMQNNNIKKLKYFYKLAYEKGAYPKWLIEFGKNMLNSCDKNAILFTGGNADFDICSYLQLHKGIRKDISVIPIGNIDRPWYVKFLKQGLKGAIRKIEIDLTEKQISEIHPFKWKTSTLIIPVSKNILNFYKLDSSYKMRVKVEPDLSSNRQHSKIASEKFNNRTYLSPQRAVLLQIIESNFNKRPIFFSQLTNSFFWGGFEVFFQNYGLVSKLTPLKTKNTEFEFNYSEIEKLIIKNNFKNYSTILSNDIPRISIILFTYHKTILLLAEHFKKDKNKLKIINNFYSTFFEIGFNKDYEKYYKDKLLKLSIN